MIQDGARFRWRLAAVCMLLIGLAGQLVDELRDRTARKMEAQAAASARAARAAEARELYGPGALYVP